MVYNNVKSEVAGTIKLELCIVVNRRVGGVRIEVTGVKVQYVEFLGIRKPVRLLAGQVVSSSSSFITANQSKAQRHH